MKVPLPFFNLKIDFIYVKRDSGNIYLGPHFDWFLNMLHLPRGKKEQNREPANEEVPQYPSEDRGGWSLQCQSPASSGAGGAPESGK